MKNLIIDCDPGHDDVCAILLAAKNPNFHIMGITTVRGNQTLDKTTKNALNVCQYLGLDIPIYAGCSTPLLHTNAPVAPGVHGESGLDGPVFPPLTLQVQPVHAVDFIVNSCLSSNTPVTIAVLGPMTNVAMALRKCPKIAKKIEQIVFMGGGTFGNITPAAEFNIYVDPEAAHIVCTAGIPLVMMGLDVTHQVVCTQDIINHMKQIKTTGAKLFVDMLAFYSARYDQSEGLGGAPIHDATTIAYLINPNIFTVKKVHLDIEICHCSSYGRTNCDFHADAQSCNAVVGCQVDKKAFYDMIELTLKKYDTLSED